MNICIYGAASDQIHPEYIREVEKLGEMLARKGHSLVFGGGACGEMGAAARGFTRGGGKILGIAPSFFPVDGVLYPHCTDFIFTETMGERKAKMEEKADAFIIAPGGVGTLEEFFEAITLKQLGQNNKPIVILNLRNYYEPLLTLFRHAAEEKFVREKNLDLFRLVNTPEEAVDYLENHHEAPVNPEFYRGVGEGEKQ